MTLGHYVIYLLAFKREIGTMWVYKLKRKPYGSVDCYKDRLVGKGYA